MGKPKRPPHIDVAVRGEIYGIKNPYRLLACAIICRAWLDYRALCNAPPRPESGGAANKRELDDFFASRWCELLLSGTSYDGDYIKEKALWST